MNTLPLHPAVVHLPLGLAAVMPLLAAGLAVAIWRGFLPRKVWSVVVVFQAVLFAGAVVALRTGEAEEERVEKRIAERTIERHEEMAEQFVWGAGVTLALSAAGMVLGTGHAPAALMAAATLATIITGGLGLRVGHAGGQLVHGPDGLTSITRAPGGETGDGNPRGSQRIEQRHRHND